MTLTTPVESLILYQLLHQNEAPIPFCKKIQIKNNVIDVHPLLVAENLNVHEQNEPYCTSNAISAETKILSDIMIKI